ncbi:ribosomal protein L4 [Metschnikowia bicuspidata var. bicuspidata NRRL YB-4993]|uniref:Large ribosomal subunit protein uL4m n=1 Tax=Metschnikowia bicuspidata var. bicuspidata NRRL YB-4993 TaxID=869754 RepID=A0A1A0H9I9_9ASCO|nr:ribosomal protein L4 [Metschnikowia bicuspidata var. bicuspidata NRRL YB-4993]OBA20681.1 ribosomal protein L4 [Metschnikowia bicuspidata var. bicuspidata NRRL YB-4993]
MIKAAVKKAVPTKLSVGTPPKYTLASLRSFPSLEPQTMAPYPATFLDHPLRRDFLWSAVVYEADKSRVGAGYVPTKQDKWFSNRKLHPQKGTGRARVGDANSPIRDNGIKAHGIKAPHDWSTSLPLKVYSRGFQTALSDQYRNGRLFVIGGENETADFQFSHVDQMRQFVEHHDLDGLHLLFITNEQRSNLLEASANMGKKCDVLVKESVEVRDLLKAKRIFIEQEALNWFVSRYGAR